MPGKHPPEIEEALKKLKSYAADESISASSLAQLMRPTTKKECKKDCNGQCRGCSFSTREGSIPSHFVSLHEAKINKAKREVDCVLISKGAGNTVDKNYYGDDAIESGSTVFDGAQAYVNHPSESEQQDLPERSVWDLAGYWKDVRKTEVVDPETGQEIPAVEATLVCDKSDAGDAALAKAEAAIEYAKLFPNSKEVYAGLSINYNGIPKGTAEVDGDEYTNIGEFVPGGSIDIVTKPARGGAFSQVSECVKRGVKISKAEAKEMTIKEWWKNLTEARKKAKEADDDSDEKKEADDKVEEMLNNMPEEMDDDAMKEMMDYVKKEESESDDEYMGRVKAAMACALKAASDVPKPGKMGSEGEEDDDGKKADEQDDEKKNESDKIVESFRKDNPEKFARIMEHARVKLGEEHKDFAAARESNKKLREENRTLKAENRVHADIRLAEAKLEKADLPESILKASDLVGMSESEMDREIERFKGIVERNGDFGGGMGQGAGKGTSESEIDLASYGISTKETKKDK